MPDQQLDILIKFGLSKEKAQEAVSELKKVEAQTKITGKEGVKQQEAVEKSTSKVSEAMKSLRQNLSHVSRAFPSLGEAARIFLNPIALAIYGIIVGFKIWKARTDELAQSLGAVELPNVQESDATRSERIAAAYGTWAANMLKLGKSADKTKQSLDNLKAAIEGNAAVAKEFGIDVGNQPQRAIASATEQAAADLRARGNRQLAIAGNYKPNNNQLAKLKELSDAAEIEKENIKGRLKDIQAAREKSIWNPTKIWSDFKFGIRYKGATTYEEGEAMERASLANQQTVIDRYGAVVRNRALRGAAFAGGNADIAGANALMPQLRDQQFGIAASTAGAAATTVNSASDLLASGNLAKMAQGAALIIQGGGLIQQFVRDSQQANATARQVQNNINQRQ